MFALVVRSKVLSKVNVWLLWNCNARSISVKKSALFAGHSKWANIKHIKAAKDGERASLFSKLSRQIRLAVQEGGSNNPALNARLKCAIEEALRRNMPMATINNTIKKIKPNEEELKRYRMDLRYKQKVFMVCVIYTNNFPALKMCVAPILRKSGVTVIDSNHIFEEIGMIESLIERKKENENYNIADKVVEDAILFGAKDVEIIDKDQGYVNFFCEPFEIMLLRKTIESNGYLVHNTEHIYSPKIDVELNQEELQDFEKFISKIKNVPGVEEVYHNIKEQS